MYIPYKVLLYSVRKSELYINSWAFEPFLLAALMKKKGVSMIDESSSSLYSKATSSGSIHFIDNLFNIYTSLLF